MRVSSGPLCEYLESYRAKLEAASYTPQMVLQRLRLIAKLNVWLVRRKLTVRSLDEPLIGRFLDQLRARHPGCCKGARFALRQLLALLRDIGALAPRNETVSLSPAERVVLEYRCFLREERGLDGATIYNYARHIERFLRVKFGARCVDLGILRPVEITAYIRREAPRLGRGHAAQMVTGLRSFFRFARYRGYTKRDLAAFVPPVANWALAGLPKYLPPGAVQRVLRHCDRATIRGKRDTAVLLLLARLGLRAGEIVAMQLEDIDWVSGELTVRSKKGGGWAKLPLPADVGRAVAAYLQVRPPSSYRNVFIRGYAPYTPFVASGPVSVLVRKAIERAGVKSARTGAHVFRHTLATEMLRHGASLDEIGQVLRHRHPDTTAIYAKVDLVTLRKLATPWAGGAR